MKNGAMWKWAGSMRPAVIEGEKQEEYKFPNSCCQLHFLSQPAVNLHISSDSPFSVTSDLLQNELQKDHLPADTFCPCLHYTLRSAKPGLQHLWRCWWTGHQNLLCLHIFPAFWCPNDLLLILLQAEQRNGWWYGRWSWWFYGNKWWFFDYGQREGSHAKPERPSGQLP